MESDKEFAALYENQEEFRKLIETILKTDESKLKDLIDLEALEKNEKNYYKKNLTDFAEYYLTLEENRIKARAIYEKENM